MCLVRLRVRRACLVIGWGLTFSQYYSGLFGGTDLKAFGWCFHNHQHLLLQNNRLGYWPLGFVVCVSHVFACHIRPVCIVVWRRGGMLCCAVRWWWKEGGRSERGGLVGIMGGESSPGQSWQRRRRGDPNEEGTQGAWLIHLVENESAQGKVRTMWGGSDCGGQLGCLPSPSVTHTGTTAKWPAGQRHLSPHCYPSLTLPAFKSQHFSSSSSSSSLSHESRLMPHCLNLGKGLKSPPPRHNILHPIHPLFSCPSHIRQMCNTEDAVQTLQSFADSLGSEAIPLASVLLKPHCPAFWLYRGFFWHPQNRFSSPIKAKTPVPKWWMMIESKDSNSNAL